MSLKVGNFSLQARTAQNRLRMGKYGTYLEFNTSQEAPKHCPTLDSPTQCFASAHFRSPPVRLQFASDFAAPPISLRLQFGEKSIPIWREISDGIWWQTKLEGLRNWRRTGGDLK